MDLQSCEHKSVIRDNHEMATILEQNAVSDCAEEE